MSVEIAGDKFELGANFKALEIIEDKSRKSISELIVLCQLNRLSVTHTVAIIWGGIYGADPEVWKRMKYDDLGEKVVQHGVGHLFTVCMTLINAFFVGEPLIAPAIADGEKKIQEPVKN